MPSFKLHGVLKSKMFLLRLIVHYCLVSQFIIVFRVLFLTFKLMFFNGIRSIRYGRKFHFAGIHLSKFSV